jgi:putative transposase
MTKKKRHSMNEIAAKLQEADALGAAGQTQNEIAKTLGISVMTFHRWRKARPQRTRPPAHTQARPLEISAVAPGPGRNSRVSELQLENARLRKLVTDLLLEKMQLEDDAQQSLTENSIPKKSRQIR